MEWALAAGTGSIRGSGAGSSVRGGARRATEVETGGRPARSTMPPKKSTIVISASRKKVEVPNFGHSTNSATEPANTMNESRWSVRYFEPGLAPLAISSSKSRMPSASRIVLSVIGHSAPDGSVKRTSGSVSDTLGISQATML